MSMDLEEQYDKIYKYCYYKLKNREHAEDITQEVFLRFFENSTYRSAGKRLQYLYTIARNLCIDEYRRKGTEPLEEEPVVNEADDEVIGRLDLKRALERLDEQEREMLLLRYANEVSASVIGELFGISRFKTHRKIQAAVRKLSIELKS